MELSKEEKISILGQHIKNISSNIFNLQVSLIEENALGEPDQVIVSNLNSQIEKERLKEDALLQELNVINAGE